MCVLTYFPFRRDGNYRQPEVPRVAWCVEQNAKHDFCSILHQPKQKKEHQFAGLVTIVLVCRFCRTGNVWHLQ